MRVRVAVTVLVGVLCMGLSACADGTFSSRRTSESEVSKYRRGAYTVYGRRLSPYSMSAYAGPRMFAGSAVSRQRVYTIGRNPRGSGRRHHVPGLVHPWNEGENHYSTNITNITNEEYFSWSGYAGHGPTCWWCYRHPTYDYLWFGYYGTPYYSAPCYHHSYGRPIGHSFRPTCPRPYYPSYAGSGIYLHFMW